MNKFTVNVIAAIFLLSMAVLAARHEYGVRVVDHILSTSRVMNDTNSDVKRSTLIPFTTDELLYILDDSDEGTVDNQTTTLPAAHRLSGDERYLDLIRSQIAKPTPNKPLTVRWKDQVCFRGHCTEYALCARRRFDFVVDVRSIGKLLTRVNCDKTPHAQQHFQ
jgi:hypothetical protein